MKRNELISCKERLNLLHETQNHEDLIHHKVSLQKTRVTKALLGKIIRRRELALAKEPLAIWYEHVFVVPLSQRFEIPAVDRTLQDCQQLLYLHSQHKTVLKNKLRTMTSRHNDENEIVEITNLKHERDHWTSVLDAHSRDLQMASGEAENLYRHLKRLELECQRLIQGGIDVVEYEDEDAYDAHRFSRLR